MGWQLPYMVLQKDLTFLCCKQPHLVARPVQAQELKITWDFRQVSQDRSWRFVRISKRRSSEWKFSMPRPRNSYATSNLMSHWSWKRGSNFCPHCGDCDRCTVSIVTIAKSVTLWRRRCLLWCDLCGSAVMWERRGTDCSWGRELSRSGCGVFSADDKACTCAGLV